MQQESMNTLKGKNNMLKIGIIGLGGISKRHIDELVQYPDKAKIVAICDIEEEKLKAVGDRLGIDEKYRFLDYKELIACDEVEAVEICTPNHLHVPMAMEVAMAGKAVEIEKPLSVSCNDVYELEKTIEKANIPNMMCFSYRFYPAVRYAKKLIEDGFLGKVININVEYLKSSAFMEGRRLEWRFVKEYAGSGVLGDLGVHLIDMTRFLLGSFENVFAMKDIVIDKRKKLDSEEYADVETDDIISFIARLSGGVIANFTVTRCAIGNMNTIKYEIYGTDGTISFNLNNPKELTLCKGEGDKAVCKGETVDVPKEFFITQEETFIDTALGKNCQYLPDIHEGVISQRIVDAILESSEKGIPVVI